MKLGPPASLPAWQSARNTPAGMPAVPTTRRFVAGEEVRTEHETSHEPLDASLDFERLVRFRFMVATHVQIWRCSLPMVLSLRNCFAASSLRLCVFVSLRFIPDPRQIVHHLPMPSRALAGSVHRAVCLPASRGEFTV